MPKMMIFDGKHDWQPFVFQFERLVTKYGWAREVKLDRLVSCMRDKALTFFTTLPRATQDSYSELLVRMDGRFGNKDPPMALRRKLQTARQQVEETLEEFVEQIQQLLLDSYEG